MQVRLLGPIDVVVDGVARPVSGIRRKALLAVIALHRGDIVSTERLVELVWGGAGAPIVANTVQTHMSQLRRLLGDRTAIEARPPGYRLNVGVDGTDVEVVEGIIRHGVRLPDPVERAGQMRTALAMWRDRPLLDVPDLPWLEEQSQRLERLRLQAAQALVDSRMAIGEHAQLLPDLESLVRDHPYDEQFHAQLMLALYRVGQQADALAVYQRLRRVLGEDLGIDPGPTLRAMESAILRQDATLELPPSATPISVAPPAPAQLPLAAPGFVGRAEELAALDAHLPQTGSAVVFALTGTAGVGKTSLAVHWAHRVADRFPDGQLYVNLRGYDPRYPALDPGHAVQSFLGALGISPERHPAGVDAQAALLRSVLANKRVLLVLDNARDARQVRPLLPGTPSCLAIVTSRNRLTSLVVAEGAHPIYLNQLSIEEAHALLAQRLGPARVAAEPAAATEIAVRCARLPLALAVVAARAATQVDLPLSVIGTELRDSASTLDVLRSDDETTDLRAVISWSYHTLSADAARLFRLLSLHRVPTIAAPAAASLLGATTAETRVWLSELTQAHLLAEHANGRYTMHDLLRAYASEQARDTDEPVIRRAAECRVLEHYLQSAHAAAILLSPVSSVRPDPPSAGVTPVRHADTGQANSWFTAERPALLAAVQDMQTFDLYAWVDPLVWAFSIFLDRNGHWADLITVNEAALAAASRLSDPARETRALRGIAGAHTRAGRYDDALALLTPAIKLLERLDDQANLARAHVDVAMVYERLGRYADALTQDQLALTTLRKAGIVSGQAIALNGIAWCYTMLGRFDLAAAHCDEAITLHRGIDDPWSLAATLDTLGYVRQHNGDHPGAVEAYHRAIELWQEAGDRPGEADTLTHLGDNHTATGNAAAARHAWQAAFDIYTELAHPAAAEMEARLRSSAVTA